MADQERQVETIARNLYQREIYLRTGRTDADLLKECLDSSQQTYRRWAEFLLGMVIEAAPIPLARVSQGTAPATPRNLQQEIANNTCRSIDTLYDGQAVEGTGEGDGEPAREPHDGWMNSWIFRNTRSDQNVAYLWNPEARKMAGDWADFRLAQPASASREPAVNPEGDAAYWRARAETAELKVLTFYEEIAKLRPAVPVGESEADKCPQCGSTDKKIYRHQPNAVCIWGNSHSWHDSHIPASDPAKEAAREILPSIRPGLRDEPETLDCIATIIQSAISRAGTEAERKIRTERDVLGKELTGYQFTEKAVREVLGDRQGWPVIDLARKAIERAEAAEERERRMREALWNQPAEYDSEQRRVVRFTKDEWAELLRVSEGSTGE